MPHSKIILIQPDGMADEPLEDLQGKTPLEAANTPFFDQLAKVGRFGSVHTIPEGFPPGSDIGNLVLMGHNPNDVFTGRAPLEAAAQGIDTQHNDVIFRVNLVTIENDVMVDFTAGHITDEEAAELVQDLNNQLGVSGLRLFPGVSYRNLAVWSDGPVGIKAEPPHNRTDETVIGYSGTSPVVDEVRAKAIQILENHPVNQARIKEGKKPATDLWFWGEGKTPTLETIQNMYGMQSGVMITAVDLLRGIAKLSGVTVVDVEGATGFIDTNYEGKCQAAIDALDSSDLVFVHIEAPDESAHMGRTDYKIKSIEDIDSYIVGPLSRIARSRGDTTIVCLPDHPTLIRTKTHSNSPVPCAVVYPEDWEKEAAKRIFSDTVSEHDFVLQEGYNLLREVLAKSI